MLTNRPCTTDQLLHRTMASCQWRVLLARLVMLASVITAVNVVFTYCGGLFGIVEFVLASVDSTLFALEVVLALSLTRAFLFQPFLVERCLQLFNPVPAYRAGLLARHSRLILPTPVLRSIPQSVNGCRAPPAFLF